MYKLCSGCIKYGKYTVRLKQTSKLTKQHAMLKLRHISVLQYRVIMPLVSKKYASSYRQVVIVNPWHLWIHRSSASRSWSSSWYVDWVGISWMTGLWWWWNSTRWRQVPIRNWRRELSLEAENHINYWQCLCYSIFLVQLYLIHWLYKAFVEIQQIEEAKTLAKEIEGEKSSSVETWLTSKASVCPWLLRGAI